MPGKYKRHPLQVRERMVERMRLGESVSELARELEVDRGTLYGWKRRMEGRPKRLPNSPERDRRDVRIEELESHVARLERLVGRQWMELDFFDSALRRVRGKGPQSDSDGAPASTPRSASGCARKAD
ncbi:MAG TPA: transposase [Candidatus Sulfotelmatobacter sp.]